MTLIERVDYPRFGWRLCSANSLDFSESFLRQAETGVLSVTIQDDRRTVEAPENSPSYRRMVQELLDGNLLAGKQSVKSLEVEGGDLLLQALAGALDRMRRTGSSD